MPSKDRATHDPQEKSGGEGWLANADQQKIVQFKPDAKTAHTEWVAVRTYRWVPRPISAANPSADAAAQRHRSLGDDAQNRLAEMLPAGPVRRCFL